MSGTGHELQSVRHPDRRVARTRTALVEALTELAQDRPVREITVKELADKARIGRSTFYEHFDHIEDLLRWLVDELIEEVRDAEGRLRLDALLAFVGGMPEVSRAFLEIDSCAERCETALAAALPHPDPSVRRFAAAGTMGLLGHWLHHPDGLSLEALTERACELVDGVVGGEVGGSGTDSSVGPVDPVG